MAEAVDQAETKPASLGQAQNVVRPELLELVRRRLTVLLQLDMLAEQRRRFGPEDSLPDAVARELKRQSREADRLPGGDAVSEGKQRLAKQAQKLAERKAKADAGETEQVPDEDGEGTHAQPIAPPPPAMFQALELASKQLALLERRQAMDDEALAAATAAIADEPLYRILEANGFDPKPLFGWTVYVLAVEGFQQRTRQMATQIEGKIKTPAGKRQADRLSEEEQRLIAQAQQLTNLVRVARKEIKALERGMVDAFWEAYEAVAVALALRKVEGDDAVAARAMLRYGLITDRPWLAGSEITEPMMAACREARTEWPSDPDVTHILYADEYIDFAVQAKITPSINEELELNDRGSDAWRMDKIRRRFVFSKVAIETLNEKVGAIEVTIKEHEASLAEIEAALKNLTPGDSNFRQNRETLREQAQAEKVEIARLSRAVQLVKDKQLAEHQFNLGEAQAKLGSGYTDDMREGLARDEAGAIRRIAKLCAKLQEPFIPLMLRDPRLQASGALNDRGTVEKELAEIERLDRDVFSDVLIPAKKQENQIYIRYSPYVVLMPCSGIMGLSWNPRSGTEVGRLGMPLFNGRPGQLQSMLYQIISDFRYDTSKESAGRDVLTSDTLVAAYATARWNFRKKSKDIREKAGIFNEEKDRVNWRRHYRMYITSAEDSGRKLFFACQEIYDGFCKYHRLPEGVEKLKPA